MRTALLADKLLERGHNILWWGSAFEHQRKIAISESDRNFHMSERYTIRVLRGSGYRRNISLSRYIDHQIVALKFKTQSKKFPQPDIIVASMPDHLLAYEAARYARKNGIPFLVDVRDLWPDIFLARFKSMGLYGMGKLVLALDFARLSFLLKNAESLVAVCKSYLNWGLDKAGRAENSFDRVFYLGYQNSNFRSNARASEILDVPAWLKGREDQKLFVFIGTFGISYDLELIVEAAKRFQKTGKSDIYFILAGTGEKSDIISKKSVGLHNVMLLGWIGQKEISTLLRSSYAGLLSYVKGAPQGLPNKPFEYLSAGLPLINSLEGEMADLIDQHRLGFNYFPGDLEGFSSCIERITADANLHDHMSRNALAFFQKYGDADKIYDEYARHIECLVEHKRHANIEVRD